MAVLIIGMIIYELLAIKIFNLTGLWRTFGAVIVGAILFSIGKSIEPDFLEVDEDESDIEPGQK